MRRLRLLVMGVVLALGVLVPAGAVGAQEEGGEPEITHEAEECIHLLEDGGDPEDCHESPSPILPETSEIVWGSISFIVLFFLLSRFAFPAIKQSMEARTNRIRDSLDEAERVRSEAQGILDEYNRQLADARNEANRIIEEARQTADQLRRDLMARAEQEAKDLRARTESDINAAKERALGDLQAQIRDLTIDLAEKIVEKELDRETNRALIDSYIRELERR